MKTWKHLAKSSCGNVAIIFGLTAVPLTLAAGMAVDYVSASQRQSVLQHAVDDAALAAGNSEDEGDAALKQLVEDYLTKNGADSVVDADKVISVTAVGDDKLEVTVTGKMNTFFMGLAGYSQLDVSASAIVTRDFGNLEVALVLDNTGSMNADGKLTSLQEAASTLIDELFDNKGTSTDLKIGIVPFAKYVNVGTDKRGESWLDVAEDSSSEETKTRTIREKVEGSEHNCGTRSYTTNNDGVSTTHTYYRCDYDYVVTGTEEYTQTTSSTWRGCVGSRDYPLNVEDDEPTQQITGLMNVSCSQAVTELIDSQSTLKTKISAMTATGSTYIPAGLMWGWRLLSSEEPFSEGVSYSKMSSDNYTKAIVLMTDGVNSAKPKYPSHKDVTGKATTANSLTEELCSNIKASGSSEKQHIVIYTVAFDVSDSTVKDILEKCATNSSYYFDAADKTALAEAFSDIAKSLITLRLSE